MARTASPLSINHPHSLSPPSTHDDSHCLEWTAAHEERLLLVQDQLSKAQRDWSEEQDLWIEEVQNLQELKRKYKKAVKKEAKRRAKKTIALWKLKAHISSSPAADSGNEADSDDANGDESPMDDKSQETSRSPLKIILRRITSSNRRSSYSGGEASSMRRRSSDWEPVQQPQSPVGFGNRLRRWSTRGASTKASSDDLEAASTRSEDK